MAKPTAVAWTIGRGSHEEDITIYKHWCDDPDQFAIQIGTDGQISLDEDQMQQLKDAIELAQEA